MRNAIFQALELDIVVAEVADRQIDLYSAPHTLCQAGSARTSTIGRPKRPDLLHEFEKIARNKTFALIAQDDFYRKIFEAMDRTPTKRRTAPACGVGDRDVVFQGCIVEGQLFAFFDGAPGYYIDMCPACTVNDRPYYDVRVAGMVHVVSEIGHAIGPLGFDVLVERCRERILRRFCVDRAFHFEEKFALLINSYCEDSELAGNEAARLYGKCVGLWQSHGGSPGLNGLSAVRVASQATVSSMPKLK